MASSKDRASHGHSAPGSSDVELLPLVADLMGWIGLLLCIINIGIVLGEDLEAVFGLSGTTPMALVGP